MAQLAEEKVLTKPTQMSTSIKAAIADILKPLDDDRKAKWNEANDKILDIGAKAESAIIDKEGRAWTLEEAIQVFQEIGKGYRGGSAAKAVDWGELLKMIIQIIQLLRDLGIIPNNPNVTMTDGAWDEPISVHKIDPYIRTPVLTINQLPRAN